MLLSVGSLTGSRFPQGHHNRRAQGQKQKLKEPFANSLRFNASKPKRKMHIPKVPDTNQSQLEEK